MLRELGRGQGIHDRDLLLRKAKRQLIRLSESAKRNPNEPVLAMAAEFVVYNVILLEQQPKELTSSKLLQIHRASQEIAGLPSGSHKRGEIVRRTLFQD